jgi:hypothetical protein
MHIILIPVTIHHLINMIKENNTEVRYLHKLMEDVGGTLKAGITLHSFASPGKLKQYSAWNGIAFSLIPPEKVNIYKLTTRTIIEEELVEK